MAKLPVNHALDTGTAGPEHPRDIGLAIQSTVSTLARIEAEFVTERATLRELNIPDAVRSSVEQQLKQRLVERSAAYVLRLAELHERLTFATGVLLAETSPSSGPTSIADNEG